MKPNLIALTGKIGCGKSQVGNYLKDKGYAVRDCDQVVAELLHSPDVQNEIVSLLGVDALKDGELNRSYVADKVFADKSLLEKYNAILHPKVKDKLLSFSRSNDGKICFCEIPLLNAFSFDWKTVWVLKATKENAVGRTLARKKNYVADLFDAQPQASGEVIENDGSLENLYKQVDALLAKLN